MTVFESKINTNSEVYNVNRTEMLDLIEQMNSLLKRAENLSEKRKPRFLERNQLTPRDRLMHLLDPGMPFLELANMGGFLRDIPDREKSVPGASLISGIGFINGVRCMITVDDSGIKAGAMTDGWGEKFTRAQDIALQQKLPFVHLVESAGADLPRYHVEQWLNFGRLFGNLAKLSAAGLPTIAVLHGASTAGGAYMPGLSDYVVAIKGRGRAFLAGPALLKAATGEETDEEELGGATMHASISGLAEYLAEDDLSGLLIARNIIDRLDWNKRCSVTKSESFSEPKYDPDEIAGIVPLDYRKFYDVREVIARIVDGSDFDDFKPLYGETTLCIQGKVHGNSCGILANNGPIDNSGATKAAQFMQLCDQADIPLVFFQNITGYMVGSKYERGGMIKHGAKMIQAVSNVRVPRITFMIGASFGAGNYGMSGYGYDPEFLFSWPNIQIGVMGGEQAAKTMTIVMEAAAKRRKQKIDKKMMEKQSKSIIEHFDKQSDAFYTSGLSLDDGIIDPRDTRKVLAFCLDTCFESENRSVRPNSFGIARL
ncbi:MAG: carboxyl transferase domain-containing protein [Pseudomonadota bacterium]|nr:carboxyl transferase domain-containing protein [Pseudomonadota bacterium]MEC9392054.1 carboxyl transferase domain-containing protein [Pseudomonadota bacterium]MEC9459519.1 carboxyl transferase domain-containing protein [Pseudomonadota bacterium]